MDKYAALLAILKDGNTDGFFQKGKGLTGTTKCSAFANQIGAMPPFLQATGAAQPTINADGSLQFDGAATFMQSLCANKSQPFTWHIVAEVDPTAAAGGMMMSSYVTAILAIMHGTASPQMGWWSTPMYGNSLAWGTKVVISMHCNGASSVLYVNGIALLTGDQGTAQSGQITIGRYSAAASWFAKFRLHEMVFRFGAYTPAIVTELRKIHGA